MNKDTIQGKWHELKGEVKTKWGKLTDNDLTQIDGKREKLLGYLQKHYGYAKEEAETELNSFEKSCGCSSGCSSKKTSSEDEKNVAKECCHDKTGNHHTNENLGKHSHH